MDHFFYASHIHHKFPYKLIPNIDELVEIFLKLSKKTVQVHLIIGTTLIVNGNGISIYQNLSLGVDNQKEIKF